MKIVRAVALFTVLLITLSGCSREVKKYKILGNIEDPQNEIANVMTLLLNRNLSDSIIVSPGVGSIANLDSLEAGRADFGIVDNYSRSSDKVTSIMPLYSQVLHILVKKKIGNVELRELLVQRKIFAGIAGSGTRMFVDQLITDLGIENSSVKFVDIVDFFSADVIFSFTDLLSNEELRDLDEYRMFSIDAVENLGKGSLAEGICMRHPQFEPYVISKNLYGSFTDEPVLTVKVDAVLVCQASLKREFVFDIMSILSENRQALKDINPLLFNISSEFEPGKLNFIVHPGARDFISRNEPTLFEKNADMLSVIISVFVALASSVYTISQWQRSKKKNKIDRYYKELMQIRDEISLTSSRKEVENLEKKLKAVQQVTIHLVMEEKLMADESFSIFLNLSKIVMEEINKRYENGLMVTGISNEQLIV
jgi:TRAP-type uncharacterized transport system substrate-binding protein